MDLYLNNNRWGDLGIDICLGPEIDYKVSFNEEMFLPEYLFKGVEEASLSGKNKIVSLTNTINKNSIDFESHFISPFLVFFSFLILSIYFSFRQIKYAIKYFLFDALFFVVSGMIGCLLIYLWFFTDHLSSFNFNLIWALPSNMIIGILLLINPEKSFIKWYMFVYGILLTTLLILWQWIPQNLSEVLILLILGIIIRLFVNYMSISKLRS